MNTTATYSEYNSLVISYSYHCHQKYHKHHHTPHNYHPAIYLSSQRSELGSLSTSASDPLRHHSHRQSYNFPSHEMMIIDNDNDDYEDDDKEDDDDDNDDRAGDDAGDDG